LFAHAVDDDDGLPVYGFHPTSYDSVWRRVSVKTLIFVIYGISC
jgi:hypothetical protein